MRGEFRLHESLRTTTVYVTHDQVEAMTLGHRVAVLRTARSSSGHAPAALRPAGKPVRRRVHRISAHEPGAGPGSTGGEVALRLDTRLPLPGVQAHGRPRASCSACGRPASASPARGCDPSWPTLTADVDVVEELGSECNLLFAVDAPAVAGDEVKAAIGGESGPDAGRLFADDQFARLTVRIQGHPPARAGGSVELAIDPTQIHLFDAETGTALELGPARSTT